MTVTVIKTLPIEYYGINRQLPTTYNIPAVAGNSCLKLDIFFYGSGRKPGKKIEIIFLMEMIFIVHLSES